MTVVNRAVRLVEIAGAVQKVAELRSIEAVLPPIDLGRGACPRLPLEDGLVAFGKLPIESTVMRDDQDHGIVDEGVHGGLVDPVAGHHFHR